MKRVPSVVSLDCKLLVMLKHLNPIYNLLKYFETSVSLWCYMWWYIIIIVLGYNEDANKVRPKYENDYGIKVGLLIIISILFSIVYSINRSFYFI